MTGRWAESRNPWQVARTRARDPGAALRGRGFRAVDRAGGTITPLPCHGLRRSFDRRQPCSRAINVMILRVTSTPIPCR